MKKTIYPILCSVLLLCSCGGSSTDQAVATKDSSLSMEASLPVMDPALFELMNAFKDTKEFAYTIDAQRMEDIKPGKELNGTEVQVLVKSPLKDDLFAGLPYTIEDFMHIDSIKAKGKYKEYVEHLEMGAIMESRSYAYAKAQTSPGSWVLFWINECSTAQACPYAYAKTIYATAISNNEVGETIVFAELSGSADAPFSFERKLTGAMPDSAHVKLSIREVSEDDQPEKEIVEGTYELNLKDGKFAFVSKDRKDLRKEKKE